MDTIIQQIRIRLNAVISKTVPWSSVNPQLDACFNSLCSINITQLF